MMVLMVVAGAFLTQVRLLVVELQPSAVVRVVHDDGTGALEYPL